MLWIDAACINQQNVSERNHQVQMMGRIYSNATSVRAWLGPADLYSDLVFDFLSPGVISKATHKELATSILSLCGREHWRRAWIRQEILQFNNVFLHCGKKSVRLAKLGLLCSDSRIGPDLDLELGAGPVANLIYRDGLRLKKASLNLDVLMTAYGKAECADKRDRVYSLISLAKDYENVAIELPIDYAQPSAFLFWQLLLYDSWSIFDLTSRARRLGPILNADDQLSNVDIIVTLSKMLGVMECITWVRSFIALARQAREIDAKLGPLAHKKQKLLVFLESKEPLWLIWIELEDDRWFRTMQWLGYTLISLQSISLELAPQTRAQTMLDFMATVIDMLRVKLKHMPHTRQRNRACATCFAEVSSDGKIEDGPWNRQRKNRRGLSVERKQGKTPKRVRE